MEFRGLHTHLWMLQGKLGKTKNKKMIQLHGAVAFFLLPPGLRMNKTKHLPSVGKHLKIHMRQSRNSLVLRKE